MNDITTLCRLPCKRRARDKLATGDALVCRQIHVLHTRRRCGGTARTDLYPDEPHRPSLDGQPGGGLARHVQDTIYVGR